MALPVRLAAVLGIASLTLLPSCSSKPTAPPAPVSAATAAASATGVSIGFSTPHIGSIKPTDLLQLKATASFADGTTGDCTDASTWTSSDPAVVKLAADHLGQVTALAAGSAKITAKCGPFSTDFTLSVLGISRVVAALPAGRSNSFIASERSSLAATATFSDGTTEDCTTASTWTSSDPRVVTVSSVGAVEAVSSGAATIRVVCRGVSSTLSLSVRPGLRITGLETRPYVLLYDQHLVLRAEFTDPSGGTIICGATWTVSNPDILSLFSNGSGFRMIPAKLGDTDVTATCADRAAITHIHVGTFTVFGTVRSTTGEPVAGASWGGTTDASGNYSYQAAESPVLQSWVKPGFRVAQLITGDGPLWNRQPSMRIDAAIDPIPNVFYQGQGTLCRADAPCSEATLGVHSFTVPRAGTMEAWIYYSGDGFEDRFLASLFCDTVPVTAIEGGSVKPNTAVLYAVNPGCHYQLQLRDVSSNSQPFPYAVAIGIR